MCRWLAYSGSPILLQEALYAPAHSLIEQSLHSRLGAETTNGDGFGIGWYGAGAIPAVFRETEPAWNDANLRELAAHVSSPLFFAHIRASSGTAIQRTNCHPFRHGKWLFMHNGLINDFHAVKRDLMLDVEPSLFASIEGQTDSELLFHLALTLGLEEDPPAASACGGSGTPARAARARCSSPPTCRRSAGCTHPWLCCSACRKPRT
jgi:predicted glutamine amidotransferase